MSSTSEVSLGTQRYLLQQQLRAQRQQIIAQYNLDAAAVAHFPRSATMRFLCGRTGMRLLTEIGIRQLGVRYPSLMINAYTLYKLFVNKKR